jgi:multicomponent Na+:H+ antiporter subunit D
VNVAAPLPVVLPILGVGLTVLLGRHRVAQRVVSLFAVGGSVVAAARLLAETRDGDAVVVRAGGWPSDLGIVLVVDLLAALLLTVSLVTVLFVLVFAVGQGGSEAESPVFHPAYLVLVAGVSLAFVTGDLFTLFVAFELMLVASYVLLTLGGRADRVERGMTYVVINLVASTLFLTAVAFVYAACGTVSLGELAVRFPMLPSSLQLAFGLLFLVVFGLKAGLFPLFSWLPDAYPTAPTSVTAVFAGLLTKVGVYALIRVTTLLDLHELRPVLLWAAGITMVVGVLGAIAQSDVKRILSFHIISQIGYMVMGLALFTVAGVAGAILFIVHQIPVKASLFLIGGLIEQREGSGVLDRVGGLVRSAPVIAGLFLLVALSLAGLPPFSGFVAKLSLVEAGTADGAFAIVGVSLLGSALTLFSMTKIWNGVFWGVPRDPVEMASRPRVAVLGTWLTTGSTAAAVVLTLGIALAAGPLYEWSFLAAERVLDPLVYIQAVEP